MPVKYADRARSTLTTPLTLTTNSGQITVAAGDGAKFMAAIDNVNTEWLTVFIVDGNNWEICDIYQDGVAVTGDDFYIDRMTWGNNNFSFPAGAKIICSVPGEWVSQINATLMTKADTAYVYAGAVRNLDNGGDAIGVNAINLQTGRNLASNVASGEQSIVIGRNGKAASFGSIAIGYNTATDDGDSIAIGGNAKTGAYDSIAIGDWAQTTNINSYGDLAIGAYAVAAGTADNYTITIGADLTNRIGKTHVIGGCSIVLKDNGENPNIAIRQYAAQLNTVFTKEIDLKVLLDDTAVLTIPTGASFFVDEIGLIITEADTVTVQPEVSFGITGNTTYLLAQTATTVNAALQRQKFTPLTANGLTSLTASVKAAATATTLKGRFYFKGLLVENE